MPEIVENRETLKWPLEKKVELSLQVIEEAYRRFQRVGVCWSGGKDSTALIHLFKRFGKPFKVIIVDTTVLFPETYEFFDRVTKEWELDVYRALPDVPWESVFFQGREVCCQKLKTEPLFKAIRELQLDALAVGVRWTECEARADEKYFKQVNLYNTPHWRVHPLLHWTLDDVWTYTKQNNIPYNPLYDRGYKSIGCRTCTVPVPPEAPERAGRAQDKETIMRKLRQLGYF